MVDRASCSIKIVGNGNAKMFCCTRLGFAGNAVNGNGNGLARAKGLL